MANFIEKLGLDFLVETEDRAHGLWSCIAQEGKAFLSTQLSDQPKDSPNY